MRHFAASSQYLLLRQPNNVVRVHAVRPQSYVCTSTAAGEHTNESLRIYSHALGWEVRADHALQVEVVRERQI